MNKRLSALGLTCGLCLLVSSSLANEQPGTVVFTNMTPITKQISLHGTNAITLAPHSQSQPYTRTSNNSNDGFPNYTTLFVSSFATSEQSAYQVNIPETMPLGENVRLNLYHSFIVMQIDEDDSIIEPDR